MTADVRLPDGARVTVNPGAREVAWDGPPEDAPRRLHARLPGYGPTPLVEMPGLAAAHGVRRVWVKDESARLGLPSFKILGASWATYRAVVERLGAEPAWGDVRELRAAVQALGPLTLAAATDGNHGRAVARMAALLGARAEILVPAGTAAARITAIRGEGASVGVVDGSYDDAVAEAARLAGERCLVIADTAWPGYETVPRWVVEGYTTILQEVDEQLDHTGASPPDLVVVPVGVGALAASVIRHYRGGRRAHRPRVLGVEPRGAACVLASLTAGVPVTVPGPHDSIMAGLNCGTPSPVAWPLLRAGLDAVAAVTDDAARQGMRDLAGAGLVAGETGAAALAGLAAADAAGPDLHRLLGLQPAASVLLLATEGATDPDAYTRVVGHPPTGAAEEHTRSSA